MRADVAIADRAQQRVRQGMKADIRIRVAAKDWVWGIGTPHRITLSPGPNR